MIVKNQVPSVCPEAGGWGFWIDGTVSDCVSDGSISRLPTEVQSEMMIRKYQ